MLQKEPADRVVLVHVDCGHVDRLLDHLLIGGDLIGVEARILPDTMEPSVLVAMDGHCLVVVPVEMEEGQQSGSVRAEDLKAVRKATKKGEDVVVAVADHGDFPPWREVLPEHRRGSPGTFTVALDVKLLAKLAEALDCERKNGNVMLTFKVDDPLSPIVVDRGWDERAFGILMPCRS